MKHIMQNKVLHILTELTRFMMDKKATEIKNKIVENEDTNIIICKAKVNITEEIFQQIKKSIYAHHEQEYDEYCLLVGAGMHCDELDLVASIIDSGLVYYENGILTIHVEINKIKK